MEQYELRIDLIKKKVKETAINVKRSDKRSAKVLVQLPAGLRKQSLKIVRAIKNQGVEPIIWGGTCYGACDLPDYDCDLLIHLGHEEFASER